jgi:hypothetical protein
MQRVPISDRHSTIWATDLPAMHYMRQDYAGERLGPAGATAGPGVLVGAESELKEEDNASKISAGN